MDNTVRVLSTLALKGAVHALAARYEAASGARIDADFAPTLALLDRLRGGEGATANSLPGSTGRKSGWLVSMTTASARFRSDVIRIGGRVKCDSMSLLGRGAGSSESAANSRTSNAPPTHRK